MARWSLLLFAMVFAAGATVAAPQAGNEYRVLSEAQPVDAENGVQVREFFSYACPHCFDFRPLLADWQARKGDAVAVQHVPVTFGRESWALLARAYYVAEALGVLDKTHAALFKAIHEQNRQFGSPEQIADFYAEQGVDREAALDAFDSFAVAMKMRRAERLVRDYGIRATPTLAVAGRYVIGVREAGGQTAMLDVASYLVNQQQAGD